jgi:hypothetical protein
MLNELVKKDIYWRKVALHICNNKDLADDIVQDMYLKLHKSNQELKDSYVYFTMKSIFLDYVKETSTKNREVILSDFTNFNLTENNYDIYKDIEIQNEIDIINEELEKDVIDKIIVTNHIFEGLRKFSRESGISINTIKKFTNDFKQKAWQRKKDLEM